VKVFFTAPAEEDLEAIGDRIAGDNPERAAVFVGELRRSCIDIAQWPMAHPLFEHRRNDGIRRKVHGNYLMFYRIRRDVVEIIHVLHGARDYGPILFGDDELD
jgi:plasmid stabilization system protein ParE